MTTTIDVPDFEERPWGSFATVHKGEGFLVKQITVNPGGRLSLQRHKHRSENWIVVAGTAMVTIDDTRKTVAVGEHARIPLGAVHRLENETDTPVVLVEVQHGDILSEDDIERLEDIYDRV